MVEEVAALNLRLEATLARFEKNLDRAQAKHARVAAAVETRTQRMDDRLAVTGQRFGRNFPAEMRRAEGSGRAMGSAIQQAGFQVGDFAVQVASGQGVLRPFIQQGTQLISMFGPWGAVLGAAGAVVGALAVSLTGADKKAEDFSKQIQELNNTLGDLKKYEDEIGGIEALRKKYGEATQAVIDLINAERELKRQKIGSQVAEITAEIDNLVGKSADTLGNLAAAFGLGTGVFGRGVTNELVEFSRVLDAFAVARRDLSFDEQAAAARQLREALTVAAERVGGMGAPARQLHDTLIAVERTLLDAAAETGEIGQKTEDAAAAARNLDTGLSGARDRASELNSVLTTAATTLANMAATAEDRLARAQLSVQFADDPVGLATAVAEREAGRSVAAAQKALADVPALLRPQLLDQIKADAQRSVAAITEAARIENTSRERPPLPLPRPFELGVPDPAGTARGGAASRADEESAARFIDQQRERVELLRQDQQLAGLSRVAQAQLTAEFERQRIVKDFLAGIQRKGIAATPEEIAQVEAVAQAYRDESVALAVLNDVLETEADKQREAERAAEEHRLAIQRIGDAISGAIIQADSFSDALKNVAVALSNIVLQKGADLLSSSLTKGLGALIGGLGGGSSGGTGTGGFPLGTFEAAKGAAFARGHLVPFARGGIVDRPTIFPMANGAGLMGEAGPEAVLPLKRGPGGRLGVEGGGRANVTVQIVNNTPAEVREDAPQRGPNGDEVRRFIIGEVKKATVRGDLDTEQRGRFGISPQRIRR